MQGVMKELCETSLNGGDELDAAAWQQVCDVRRHQWEKALKLRFESAIEQFNEDYRKGFQFMQVRL
jgi:hypothetical protein